jgi:hypothetical protein
MNGDTKTQGGGRGFRLTAIFLVLVNTIISGLVGYLLTKGLDDVNDALTKDLPSCSDPLSLVQLEPRKLSATGPWYFEGTSIAQEPESELHDFENLRAKEAIDGRLNTLWVPPTTVQGGTTFYPAEGRATLNLSFPASDVQLVCIVNGYAAETQRYRNWGRVRTMEAATDHGVETSILQSLGDCCFQDSQKVAVKTGMTDHLGLTIDSAYSGQIVLTYDGDFCDRETQIDGLPGQKGPGVRSIDPDDPSDPNDGWELAFPKGCYIGAEAKAGIAEVMIYVKKP